MGRKPNAIVKLYEFNVDMYYSVEGTDDREPDIRIRGRLEEGRTFIEAFTVLVDKLEREYKDIKYKRVYSNKTKKYADDN